MTLPPRSQLDDLLEAYKAGDYSAFERFFRQSKDVIFRYVLQRIRNPEKAAEITQETFFRVHRYILSFDRNEGLAIAWIYGIARNCVADYLRGAEEDKALLASEGTFGGIERQKESDRFFFSDLIRSLEKELSEEDLQLLIERVIGELSFDEIADKHGIKTANARQRFGRILKKVRDIF